MKSKIRRSCENYCHIKPDDNATKVINKLSNEKNISVIKQDKGRGVILLDIAVYIQKCMEHLNSNHFIKLETDKTKNVEETV